MHSRHKGLTQDRGFEKHQDAFTAGLYHTESDIVMVILEDWATCPRVRHVFQFPHSELALTPNSTNLYTHISKRLSRLKSSTKFWRLRKKVFCTWAIHNYQRYSLFVPEGLSVPEQMHVAHSQMRERGVHCPHKDIWDMHCDSGETELRSVDSSHILPYWQLFTRWKIHFAPHPELAIHPIAPFFADEMHSVVEAAEHLMAHWQPRQETVTCCQSALVQAAAVALAIAAFAQANTATPPIPHSLGQPHAYGL